MKTHLATLTLGTNEGCDVWGQEEDCPWSHGLFGQQIRFKNVHQTTYERIILLVNSKKQTGGKHCDCVFYFGMYFCVI